MNQAMAYRGPDSEGFLIHDGKSGELLSGDDTPKAYGYPHISTKSDQSANVFLGHRRLSIIDLTQNGHQPVLREDGQSSLMVFNGEIYNFHELEKQFLSQERADFNSDTRVLFSLLNKLGISAVEHLRGMFAFAYFDLKSHKVYLVRDRIGIKPLYYAVHNNRLIFGSEIRTILASKEFTPEVSIPGLWQNYSYRVTPRPNTSFKVIKAVLPGHYLEIDLRDSNVKTVQYWDLPTGVRKAKNKKSVIEETESLIEESINYRLISDVEVSSFLSAGIDSNIVTAIAAKKVPHFKGLTLAMDPNSKEDESYIAGINAKKYGIEHRVSKFNPSVGYDDLRHYLRCCEEPSFTLPPVYFLSKVAAEENMKVILNGLGGDEFFGGYPVFKYLKYRPFRKILRPFLKLKRREYSYNENILYNMVFSDTYGTFYGANYTFFSEDEKKKLFHTAVQEDPLLIWDKMYDIEDMTIFDAIVYLSSKHFLANHALNRGDALSMYHSLEIRSPLLDHKLVEHIMTIPQNLLLRTKEGKYILREILKPKVDSSTLKMKKKGFTVPPKYWMSEEMKKLTRDKLEGLKKRGMFNPEEIENIYSRFINIDPRKVWHLVMTEVWFEEFIDGQ